MKEKKIFNNTDAKAFKIAGLLGGSPESKSAIYYTAKRIHNFTSATKSIFEFFSCFSKKTNANFKNEKHPLNKKNKSTNKNDKTIFDLVREIRSTEIISDISNKIACFTINSIGKDLSENEKNIIRSITALTISEVANKLLEEQLTIVNEIEMFIEIGKNLFKIVIKHAKDKQGNFYATNSIKKHNNYFEYISFLDRHPNLKQSLESLCPKCGNKMNVIYKKEKKYWVCPKTKCGYKTTTL